MRIYRLPIHRNSATAARVAGCISGLLVASLLAICSLAGCGGNPPASWQPSGGITARQLVAPNALVGPGPSILSWSPAGAKLAYTDPTDNPTMLWVYDAATGEKTKPLSSTPDNIDVTTAQWSPDGNHMLVSGDKNVWVLQLEPYSLTEIPTAGSPTALMFLPSGKQVSFVSGNDIYMAEIGGGQKAKRLTTDGSASVYNGTLDWVYTEELATRAEQPGYAWSPDGKQLVFLRLDDTKVQNHPITDYRTVPPAVSYTRYPVTGTANPVASLHVITPDGSRKPQTVPLPSGAEYVLPFFTWNPDGTEALYITVIRDHKTLTLNAYNPADGANRTVIEEKDPHWINEDFYAAPVFLGGGQRFLWLSERDGFMHLYLYSRQGELQKQLMKGDWLIDSLAFDILSPGRPVQVDPSGTVAYFTATRKSPLERQSYRLDINSGELRQLSREAGFHAVTLSGDGQYLVDQFSSVTTPPVTYVSKSDGSGSTVLAKCAGPSVSLPAVKRTFQTVKAHDGTTLYAQMVKPANFDPKKKYGVVVHWYGGPGLQLVSNRYGTTNIFNQIERDVLYTQEGFIVWRLDNRGSYGRGHAFETPIEGHLGPAALDDQLAGVEYLKTLPYVDAGRIGTDGKSFGGFLTLYALIHEPDVFKCGVAGSGVTDWKYYDTIYTERYMGTPAENPDGYESTELISRAGGIKARPLIIHGLADTNVHLQNSVNFIQELEKKDRPFDFVPLPNEDHHYEGDGLVTALSASAGYFARYLSQNAK